MPLIWDYPKDKLAKSKRGKLTLLERLIIYGPQKESEKIPLSDVKKYWSELRLPKNHRRLMELLIWGKIRS